MRGPAWALTGLGVGFRLLLGGTQIIDIEDPAGRSCGVFGVASPSWVNPVGRSLRKHNIAHYCRDNQG